MGLFRSQLEAQTVPTAVTQKSERLMSLDVLRGLDIFFLIGLQPFLLALLRVEGVFPSETRHFIRGQLTHTDWVGFTTWDLVMPLFLFMSGVTLPFALAKHKSAGWKQGALWGRLIKRLAILWLFGGIIQGQFLGFDWNHIYLFSNTLQAIAIGTLIAFPAVLLLSVRWQVLLTAALLALYGLFFILDGERYAPGANIAEQIDCWVLGRFRDGASMTADGVVRFSSGYHYSWALSSLGFGAQLLLGAQAGNLLRSGLPAVSKVRMLSLCGFGLVSLGWLVHLFHPVIKPLYTSSMVMVSSGYAFLLLMFFYFVVDLRKIRKPFEWLTVIGCNALMAYVLYNVLFSDGVIARKLAYGLEKYVGGGWFNVILAFFSFLMIYAVLWVMKRANLFWRA